MLLDSNIYFRSDLPYDKVIVEIEKVFNKKSFTRDDFNEREFRMFGFSSLLLDTIQVDKNENYYLISYNYIPSEKNVDLTSNKIIFNEYIHSIIYIKKIGIPTNIDLEDINIEHTSSLTSSSEFSTNKIINEVTLLCQILKIGKKL